jgi:hypothetical protein
MLRAPFPWFGGKSRAAGLIWPRFGDATNYVEPFAGSLAVLLARPEEFPPRVETVNDRDAYLSNFWRAVQADPDAVAHHADWPVNEADLHARHRWLVDTARERVERVMTDPDFYDAKVAGWWVWGQCLWIGSGWCARPEWTGRVNAGRNSRGIHTDRHKQRPDLTNDGRGVLAEPFSRMGDVLNQKRRPQLSNDNGTVALAKKRPNAMGNGQAGGVHAERYVGGRLTKQQVPDLSGSRGATGRGIHATAFEVKSDGLYAYMRELQARLRRVRVCCGDWSRVVTPAVTTHIGTTAVLLDPPYLQSERSICYSHDEDVSAAVREWALEHGDDPKLRIALCGYEGEHEMPGWDCIAWHAGGGYGRSARGKSNRHRERIWFSPHCLRDERLPLLTEATA